MLTDNSVWSTATLAWKNSILITMLDPGEVTVRGMKTKEVMNQTIQFKMNRPVCHHEERKLSYTFMAAEAYWITSGALLTEEIEPYNKHIAQFSDDGHIFNGAYGPMFISQVEYVANQLFSDLSTRQAVMTIWVPNPIHSKDYRCTISLIFNVRDGHIHTTVLMRSNDLILGRPYDMFNFTVMTLRVLTRLNKKREAGRGSLIKLGTQTLHAVSAHVYDNHYEMANRISVSTDFKPSIKVPERCLYDWKFVTDSLLACRDQTESEYGLNEIWRIRP